MFLQSRAVAAWTWWSWLVAGFCGVLILLLAICYCRLMPRHQKSFDEQYLKESYTIKENHVYSNPGTYSRSKHSDVGRGSGSGSGGGDGGGAGGGSGSQGSRNTRPASYAGDRHPRSNSSGHHATTSAQYASSGMLDDLDGEYVETVDGCDALKTRSLPAFLRPRPRPLSSETDLYQLYAKVSANKKQRSRMRSEHAALIALSKARSAPLDDAAAVIVYDQRTQL